MSGSSASGFGEDKVCGVRINVETHVTSVISNGGVGIGGKIVH